MTLPDLDETLARLQRRSVRDLAWTLLSPPLLGEPPCRQRHPLAGSGWHDRPERLVDWLVRHDDAPEALETWLARGSTRRLGLYYERLWQYALTHAPGVELLAANVPVRRQGHTLGELDLLLRDADGLHHLELAVKLYLGLDADSGQFDRWIGPGGHDRLDLKLDRLQHHQLPLCATDEARDTLREFTREPVESSIWLAGYLFDDATRLPQRPFGTHPALPPACWLRYGERQRIGGGDDSCWQWLPRACWLAPATATDGWDGPAVRRWLDSFCELRQPQLLARLRPGPGGQWLECGRVFIVPDDWPAQG